MPAPLRTLLKPSILVIGFATAAVAGYFFWKTETSLKAAESARDRFDWPAVRNHLDWYLRLHPNDPPANLMMAQAFFEDETLEHELAVKSALNHLYRIPDSSSLGPEARLQEARILIFFMRQPVRAEEKFRKVVELDPDNLPAWTLLWKLHDMTGRSHLAEPIFWKAYELSPLPERGPRLRDWFMSQFYPVRSTATTDANMGFGKTPGLDAVDVEIERFQAFITAEPDRAQNYAMMAREFLHGGQPQGGLNVLDEADGVATDLNESPIYTASAIELLIEAGRLEDAVQLLDSWPGEQSGFEYWRLKGRLYQTLGTNLQQAVDAFEQSAKVWPGIVDWRSLYRLSKCYDKLNDPAKAEETRNRANALEEKLEREKTEDIWDRLQRLEDTDKLKRVVEFYQGLGCDREAQAWTDWIEWQNSRKKGSLLTPQTQTKRKSPR